MEVTKNTSLTSLMMTGSLANFDFTLILKRAVEYDEQCKYKEALMNYENGLELMLKSIKGIHFIAFNLLKSYIYLFSYIFIINSHFF